MKCKKCNSDNVVKNGTDRKAKRQVYKCKDCGKKFLGPLVSNGAPKVGMTLDQFKAQYDTEYRIDQALKGLSPELIYEKQDVLKLAGLPIGTAGASTILETRKDYYGKINSKMLFSHPKTIRELKEHAKLN